MYHTVDARLYLHESAEIGQTAYFCANNRTGRIFLRSYRPWIGLSLLEPQRDFLLFLVDTQHNHLYFVTEIYKLARMRKALGPAHLTDMHKTLNTIFKPHENTIAHYIYNFALDRCPDRITMFDILPGAGCLLLEAQRNLLVLFIDTDNNTFDLLIELDNFRWMRYSAPAQIGNMQQTVQASQVHEHAEIGDVFHNTLS